MLRNKRADTYPSQRNFTIQEEIDANKKIKRDTKIVKFTV